MTFGSHRSLRQNSYLSLLSLAASCFLVVRLAHSYPNGAPLVAITGQVGRTAGYDHSPFPVSSLPQSRLALQGNKKRRVPIHILYFFICSLSFLFLNKYYFCRYSAINFPKSNPEHYTVTPSSSGRSGWSAGKSPFGAFCSAGSFSAASASSGPRWRAC